MSTLSVRIRGIYATALTAIALEHGFAIADPCSRVQERFALSPAQIPVDVFVEDRDDRQGVQIQGTQEALDPFVGAIQEKLIDACFWRAYERPHEGPTGADNGGDTRHSVRALAEFPATTKQHLDLVRRSVLPTIPGHHYLKSIDPAAVDSLESTLGTRASDGADQARNLKQRIVYTRFRPGADAPVQHVKPGVRTVLLRGKVSSLKDGILTLSRVFQQGGLYDSLNVPKLAGDWGTLVLPEGDWVSTRQYFRKSGALIGEIYNIGTPTELYLGHVRYVDLEVDVVRWPDGRVKVVDQEDLDEQVRRGHLSESLADKARRIAEDLARNLTK